MTLRQPGFTVNDALVIEPVAYPAPPDVDLAETEVRVRSWGGRPDVYRHHVAAAVKVDASTARSAAVLAAWRAGVVRLRHEALATLLSTPPLVAEAALGLLRGEYDAFLHAQAGSRFGHPGVSGEIARLGGFRGLGGLFLEPPTEAHPTLPGLAVRSGSVWWHLEVDVFGQRATPLDDPGEVPAATRSDVVAVLSPDSYLVSLRRAS